MKVLSRLYHVLQNDLFQRHPNAGEPRKIIHQLIRAAMPFDMTDARDTIRIRLNEEGRRHPAADRAERGTGPGAPRQAHWVRGHLRALAEAASA
jgi:hypothetical protein